MRKLILIVSGLCLVFMACKHPVPFKEVQSRKDLFTLQVPVYMNASDNMFPGKSVMEYGNDSVALYLLAFDTSRDGLNEKTLKAYYDSTVSRPTIDSAELEQPKLLMVNGDSAYATRMTGYVNGVKLFYRIETIATPEHFFYILIWAKAEKENELKMVIDKVFDSFHDINHKKV
ncbi:MAG: hypothetical protein ACLQQ4_18970 [Bacteroidia bacterium]